MISSALHTADGKAWHNLAVASDLVHLKDHLSRERERVREICRAPWTFDLLFPKEIELEFCKGVACGPEGHRPARGLAKAGSGECSDVGAPRHCDRMERPQKTHKSDRSCRNFMCFSVLGASELSNELGISEAFGICRGPKSPRPFTDASQDDFEMTGQRCSWQHQGDAPHRFLLGPLG